MKRLLCIAAFIIVVTSCTKNTEEKTPSANPSVNPSSEVPEVNGGPMEWTSLPVPSNNPFNSPTKGSIVIPVNGDVFCVLGGTIDSRVYKLNAATERWELFTDFAITVPGSKYLFSHGTKIYWCFLRTPLGTSNAFSCIDVVTGVKTDLTTFPGTFVDGSTNFVVGDKGYLLGGYTLADRTINQHWEYNFTTNQWTDRGSSILGARSSAPAFVVGNKVYLGLGFSIVFLNGFRHIIYKDDWYSYTPGSPYYAIWTDFPAGARSTELGFVINGLPYVGWGRDNNNSFTDLWRYNVSGNSWTQQTSWPGSGSFAYLSTFSFNNAGYVIKGGLNQFWKYSN